MNRTKTIYFLSAIVCIIGCYALSLSYSLFVDTQEREIVNATVPGLSYSLETSTFDIESGSGELIKLKVINSGSADLKYGIKAVADTLNGATIQLVEKEDNDIVGELSASTTEGETSSKEVWVYVTNDTESNITGLKFVVEAKYSTLNFDADTFKTSSNIDCVNTVKLLNNAILARAKSTEITDEEKTVFNDTFDLNNITGISSETDRMLALAEDDYGTSYVFRGNILDNYIEFAGFTWRIVRINGDGTIRLILDGTLDSIDECNNYSICKTTNFNDIENDNAYVGYMFGDTKSSDYDTTHKNTNSSTIKTLVDNFYKEYIYSYEKYLDDTLFCGDKTRGVNSLSAGFYGQTTYYSGYERLYNFSSTAQTTLKCASNNIDTTLTEQQLSYSRYTTGKKTSPIIVNNNLEHPIALLSADEMIMAGAFKDNVNNTFYLYDAYDEGKSDTFWWTMTPANYTNKRAIEFIGNMPNSSIYQKVYTLGGVRPVINLKAETIIEGIGTKNEPYKIKK